MKINNDKVKIYFLKFFGGAIIFNLVAAAIIWLNFNLDKGLLNMINEVLSVQFADITWSSLAQKIGPRLFIYHTLIFFLIFSASYLIINKLKKKINVLFVALPIIFLILIRSIISEPWLYQFFYINSTFFKFFVDLLLYYDLKLFFDIILFLAAGAAIIISLRYYAIFAFLAFAAFATFINYPLILNNNNSGANNETILFVVVDSLRKDVIKDNPDSFLHKIYSDSLVLENMYTVNPASMPTMAAIFSNNYPYKAQSAAIFLGQRLDLSFVNDLKKEYLLSIHTDFADDEVVNHPNFNIPFDYFDAPLINSETRAFAEAIKKDIILMAFVGPRLRPLLIPQYYQADNKGADRTYINSAVSYMAKNRQNKKIVFLSLSVVHMPLEASYPYYRPYLKDTNRRLFKWASGYYEYKYAGHDSELNQNFRNLYAMGVDELDDEIEYLFKKLSKNNLLENTTVVIASDHGENIFDEDLPLYSHNNLNSRHVLQVPFIIYRLGVPGAKNIEQNFSLVDGINIARDLDNLEKYKREYVYIENDFDLKNKDSYLYVDNVNEVYGAGKNGGTEIKNQYEWYKSKKRAIIYKNFQLSYKPESEKIFFLYDIEKDPLYQNDIKDQEPEIFLLMKSKLNEFIKDSLKYSDIDEELAVELEIL